MPLNVNAACGRPRCAAQITTGPLLSGRAVGELTDQALWVSGKNGWDVQNAELVCPACVAGNGPVLEPGECPKCGGRTASTGDADRCMYCGAEVPAPEGWDEGGES